uniref:Uncharacterized protein n=1 Tax=Alexandrium andersonii TaxID=327968 RepID=A0A7S2DDV5_9DINO|mmetsp:Transcript_51792/g.117132  ORF Transcript_51792/g.117132 Transcript_51792/m.117132 type:complete len:129 (+) Transcript_51792:3-389(+)
MREVRGAKAKLDCATTTLDITRRDLEGAKDKVRSLNDTQDMSSAVQMKLLKQLEETSTFANRTAEGLKETNSLVLPNLKLDATLPRGTTGFGTCDSRAATARETRRPTPTFNKERPVMDYSRQAQAGM